MIRVFEWLVSKTLFFIRLIFVVLNVAFGVVLNVVFGLWELYFFKKWLIYRGFFKKNIWGGRDLREREKDLLGPF